MRLFSCSTLILIPFLLAGLLIAASALREWYVFVQLRSTGITTQAQIINSAIETDDSTAYYFGVRFMTTDARELESRTQVSQTFYYSHTVGDTITLRYLPQEPITARADWNANEFPGFPLFMTLFAIVWNVMMWGMFIGTLLHSRKMTRLALGGEKLIGEITHAKSSEDEDNNHNITIRYSFQSPIGATLNGKDTQQRNDLKQLPLPSVGTPVAIFYHDEQTYIAL